MSAETPREMPAPPPPPQLRMIPIERIEVLNPRERNLRVFEEIVANINSLGLKKPITVTPKPACADDDGPPWYLLVCGEGRLKAFATLGQTVIPALVVQVSEEDALIMSLAENITRRQFRPLEMLSAIERLRAGGYDTKTIARKTGLSSEYINGIVKLLVEGEERLLVAVESGRLPITAAIAIVRAGADQSAVQHALEEAYASGQLRGKQLIQAKRLVEQRQLLGSSMARRPPRKPAEVTASSLVRTYQREIERQKQLVRKSDHAQSRLMFVVGAMQRLLADEHFVTLLRAERLETLPSFLAERVGKAGSTP